MTARKTPAAKAPTDAPAAWKDIPGWKVCAECGHKSTGRIVHGPHPTGGKR
jgi:hypothetical protein